MGFIKRLRWQLIIYDLIIFALIDLHYILYEQLSSYDAMHHFLVTILIMLGVRLLFGVYYQVWRYGGVQSYLRVLVADTVSFIINTVIVLSLDIMKISFVWLLAIGCLNTIVALGMRMCYRYAYKCASDETLRGRIMLFMFRLFSGNKNFKKREDNIKKTKVGIIGAGKIGVNLAEELLNNPNSSYQPACFLDLSQEKVGRTINDIPVLYSDNSNIAKLKDYNVQEVILAAGYVDDELRKRIYATYKEAGFKVKVYDYPAMHTAGKERQLREFDIEELLFRKPVEIDNELAKNFYQGKKILITGGGGSIGSEIARQLIKYNPEQLIILDVYENSAYELQQEIKIIHKSQVKLHVEIISICNRPALERIFAEYHPDIVIMAAAHKHVPLMERNCIESVENNIFGTLNTVELAIKYEAQRVIMVSTDKAVNPTSIMGATKRFCEMIVNSYAQLYNDGKIKTTFSSTRFGNVLGSAGSVIPLFKKQIANGGPVTVTHKDIIRYFMTIPEASQLVLQSGAMAKNGELFVLDMGEPVKIYDLAANLIELSGYVPGKDIEIIETGLRPGEKLYEELLIKTETLEKTANSLIFVEKDDVFQLSEIAEKLSNLKDAVKSGSNDRMREVMHEVIPSYVTPEEVNSKAIMAKKEEEAKKLAEATIEVDALKMHAEKKAEVNNDKVGIAVE